MIFPKRVDHFYSPGVYAGAKDKRNSTPRALARYPAIGKIYLKMDGFGWMFLVEKGLAFCKGETFSYHPIYVCFLKPMKDSLKSLVF